MLANPNFHFPGRQNMTASTTSAPSSPTPLSTSSDVKSKRRSSSHSRQLSLSNSSSQSSPTSPARPTSTSRPVSGHHRRQSSVSSRRESREIMGLASPTDTSEESFSGDSRQHALWALEGKTSVVSGLTLGFSKVEIPDWQTPDGEKEEFTWPSSTSSSNGSAAKRTLTPGSTTPLAYTPSSSLANKRDSFGKSLLSASSSLKEQLHTLMEEDEDAEEEEEPKTFTARASEVNQAPASEIETAFVEEPEAITEDGNDADIISNDRVLEEPAIISTPVVPNIPFDLDATPLASLSTSLPSDCSLTETPASPSTSPRPRPPTLQLRPLSLVPSLPMTSQTSTAAINNIPHSVRYKSLTLATTLPAAPSTNTSRNTNDPPKRQSIMMTGTQSAPSSLQLATINFNKQRRRGSIGYRRSGEDYNLSVTPSSSAAPLRRQSLPMTPGLTPNTAVTCRSNSPTTPSDSISSSRASSEFFQNQAVSSLLCRIASLEEALALSTAATSPSSDAQMSFPSLERLASLEEEDECGIPKAHMSRAGRQSTDDLIDIIAELKAERDELNGDIVGWRTRCADLTHSSEALQRRLADERRELLLLHQRLSSVTADLNESRSAKLKLEDELVMERASSATAISERQQLEEELNDERMERIALEMKSEKERLAWQKERNGWETEREGWFEERAELEETVKRCEDSIASLRAQLDDRTREIERLQGPSNTPAPPPKQPWTGGKFAFPPPQGPPRSESPPEQPRPRTSTGFGGLNTGFKFGGGSSIPSSSNSAPKPLPYSSATEGLIPPRGLVSVVEDDSSRSSAVNLNSPPSSPVSAPAVAPAHQHRRSVSRVANWRFPSPRVLEQRRNATANTVKEKKDRFFACLEDEEDNQGQTAPMRLIGKPMKPKEHKKLPSGCPAFWLDCDEDEPAVKRVAPLPSPATTEEEDDTETESVLSKSPVSTTLSFPLIPRTIVTPASASNSRASSPVDAPNFKAKHVDPDVMRERLRLQLEREGRLSPKNPHAMSGKVVTIHGALAAQPSIESEQRLEMGALMLFYLPRAFGKPSAGLTPFGSRVVSLELHYSVPLTKLNAQRSQATFKAYQSAHRSLRYTVGAGAVGCFYGSRLHNPDKGVLVSLICRSNYKAIASANGVTMKTRSFGDYFFSPEYVFPSIEAAASPSREHLNKASETNALPEFSSWDYLVVTTKALPDVSDDSGHISPLVKVSQPGSQSIVLIQNGVGVEEPYRKRYGDGVAILSAVTVVSAEQIESGVIKQNRWTRVSIGPYTDGAGHGEDGRPATLDGMKKTMEFIQLLKDGGIKDAEEHDERDLQAVRWHKIAINAAMNPSAVLSNGAPNATMVKEPELREHLRGCMLEVFKAAEAVLGIQPFPPPKTDKLKLATADAILTSTERNEGGRPSMLGDWERGVAMELEVILGNPIRAARAKGVEMPHLQSMYALLKMAQTRRDDERQRVKKDKDAA
ncbi:hypothetical protein FRB90_003044, partial [Tulasnella sp. 427]